MIDDEYKKMLVDLIDRLANRHEKTDDQIAGITKAKLKLLLIEAVDPDLLNEVGKLLDGKRMHTVMTTLLLTLGDVIGHGSGNHTSVCLTSEVITDMLHDYAHFCYDHKNSNGISATHPAPESKQ